MMQKCNFLILVFLIAISVPTFGQSALKFAELGDFVLENGSVIRNCRLGYMSFGELNAAKSNAILFPTWFGGTGQDISRLIEKGNLLDTSRYFVIAVDALGNGVSSSPSNSKEQPGKAFPIFTIRDMVRSQHKLLTEVLAISHLFAVVGGSMGGMQAFEWIVSYPNFMDRAVCYVSTPRPGSYDLLLCHTHLHIIESAQKYGWTEPETMKALQMTMAMVAQTPGYRVGETSYEEFPQWLASFGNVSETFTIDNWASQLRAIITHDVSAPFGGDLKKAAAVIKAKVFIIVSMDDHMVTPQTSLEFAQLIGAKTLKLESDHGHLAISNELKKVTALIADFWEDRDRTAEKSQYYQKISAQIVRTALEEEKG